MDQEKLKEALIMCFIWGFTYLYIRRYMNPENDGNVERYRMDAIYGGLAAGANVIILNLLRELMK